jgi:uncharacterized protein DUF3653
MCRESLAAITVSDLAALGRVHLATARRWKRTGKCPRSVERLVRVCHCGELDDIHAAWRGWRLVRGTLYSPEGWEFTPGAVRTLPLLERQVREMRRERGFIAQADWLTGRFERPRAVTTSEPPHRGPPATHAPGRRPGPRSR